MGWFGVCVRVWCVVVVEWRGGESQGVLLYLASSGVWCGVGWGGSRALRGPGRDEGGGRTSYPAESLLSYGI